MHHVISETETFGRRLVARLETCSRAIIATAFFTRSGLDDFKHTLKEAVKRRANITFLLGQFDYVTEPRAVATLLKLGKIPGARLRVLFDHEFEFHYKVALFRDEGHPVVILGSSNITGKGLSSRGEDNVEIVEEAFFANRLAQDLEGRVSIALEAEKHLPNYARLYDKYRQLRMARERANRAGNRKLSARTRRATPIRPLDFSSLN
jgi:HKD family nuclease